MSSPEDWCNDQVSKLVIDDLRVPTLNEIKNHLLDLPHAEALQTANVLELSAVFDCLNVSNSEQVDLACEVLVLCMSHLTLGDCTNRYAISIERSLNHPQSSVKTMVLSELQRTIGKEELLNDLSKRGTLICAILRCIGDEDLYVSKKASEIICQIGRSALPELLKPEIVKVLHEVMTTSEVKRLRINEVFIKISQKDQASMNTLASAGLLSQILQDLNSNDILLKLNIIEILGQLVTTNHGYDYLESQGTIRNIFKITEEDNDPLAMELCEPGILKFFGQMAHWKPTEILNKYPKVVKKIFSNIISEDLMLVGVSLDTLGYIAETNEGKIALDSTGDGMLDLLKSIPLRITSLPTELRIRMLNCLESILKVLEFESRITNLVRKWYYTLGDDPFQWIYKFAQNPFSEIRLAGFGVIHAISMHHWGQECFKNVPGFIEFLLDRKCETFKNCKEAKYNIVKGLASSMVFDHSTQLQLQAFVKEGPFYVQAGTDVAVEGQD